MPKMKAQIKMDDNWVKNPEVEAILEKRQSLKQGATDYRNADKEAKTAVAGIPNAKPYRIGRFIIEENDREAKHVEFDSEAGKSIIIKTADE